MLASMKPTVVFSALFQSVSRFRYTTSCRTIASTSTLCSTQGKTPKPETPSWIRREPSDERADWKWLIDKVLDSILKSNHDDSSMPEKLKKQPRQMTLWESDDCNAPVTLGIACVEDTIVQRAIV